MAKSKKSKAFNLKRKNYHFSSRSVRAYAARVGEVVWAWNYLHNILGWLFVEIVLPSLPETADAIWHSVRNDSGQRAMLRAALDRYPNPVVLEGTRKLLKTIELLAPHRNAATHVPTRRNWTEKGYVIPSRTANPQLANRLASQPNLRAFHRFFRDDLLVLSNYAAALWIEAKEPGARGPFPELPKLRSLS